VRQLKEFNHALLGKWCWRLLVDRGFVVSCFSRPLWRNRWEVGGRSCSHWWREVARIREGGGDVGGGWFGECVSKKLGDGSDTLFWFDRWVGVAPLRVRNPQLFALSENKFIIVANLFAIGFEQGGGRGGGGGGCGRGRKRS